MQKPESCRPLSRSTAILGRCLRSFPLAASVVASGACGGGAAQPEARTTGQTEFLSAPPPGQYGAQAGSATAGGGAAGRDLAATPPSAANAGSASTAQPRSVQETDLYRLDGNRLYYLNAYRGLMVFDVSVVDRPKLLGRSAIFGTPVQMFVKNGVAVVVVADWYGTLDSGEPFHGSIVRGLDATDPGNIRVLGEAKLGGWVQDTRIVGDVLYAVSEDFGWVYGWAGGGVSTWGGVAVSSPGWTASRDSVIVSSVSFANGAIRQIASKTYAGYGGVFNVTPTSILLAHPVPASVPGTAPPALTALQYLDISDPAGNIVERGSIEVAGSIQGWGADNGRWNLDFADGRIAHVIGCSSNYDCSSGYVLATTDFSNPDQPELDSELSIPSNSWSGAARFDGLRMYLSPSSGYSWTSTTTPLEIFDLSNPRVPVLAGNTQIPGTVWLMIPSGNQLFALGQDSGPSQVSLKYLDVTNPAFPKLIGTSNFGDGWAWTPAAQTFKAFTKDATQGLVVLPFSGWSASAQQYENGVQLIEFTPNSITTAGAAHTKGWVERGIFANGRILSLSDMALSVVDYSDPLAPTITAQLTLARNVVAAQPADSTVAEISSDWWGNDLSQSQVRVLPASDAAEDFDESQAPSLDLAGVNARVFTHGSFAYVVTTVQVDVPCSSSTGVGKGVPAPLPGGPPARCSAWKEQVTVVDLAGGGVKARGTVALPMDPNGWSGGWGWRGFYYDDWYVGEDVVQVEGDALAFRRWHPNYGLAGQYVSASSDLFVVDLSNPDAPSVASTAITNDPNGWWGNMKVVGKSLYTTHYVWPNANPQYTTMRYYLDAIDLTDRKNPKVQGSINVPGILVGGSETDPSILYTVDYRWYGATGRTQNEFDAVRLVGGFVRLESATPLSEGWVGNVVIRGDVAYTSTQRYDNIASSEPAMQLHQIDLTNPAHPVDRIASGPHGWGALVDVQGDRMLVTSGWGSYYSPPGLDVYRLTPSAAPAYDQFVRTLGWSISSVARQNDKLFLSSGDWGVQAVQLK